MGRHCAMRRGGTFVSPAQVGPSSLLDGLLAHFRLDESEGNRVNSVGEDYLSASGAAVRVEGHCQPYSTQFDPNNETYLYSPFDSLYGFLAGSWTAALWFALDAVNPTSLLGRWGAAGLNWSVFFDGTYVGHRVSSDGETIESASDPLMLETATWYLAIASCDTDNYLLRFQLNDRTVITTPFLGKLPTGGERLELGRDSVAPSYMAGRIESVSLWNRLLTGPEVVQLYNGGAGRAYPFL